jgi:hypothetical protein
MKRLVMMALTASLTLGSAWAAAASAAPMPQAVPGGRSDIIQVRSDDFAPFDWRHRQHHYDRDHRRDRHDDRRYWHRERYRDRDDWRRDRWHRHHHGPAIILNY